MKLVLTCEHAGNLIPPQYEFLFKDDLKVLNTHRGFDPGAYDLFHHLSDLADFKYAYNISRLLVELNRSIGHPTLFSEFSNKLSSEEKKDLLEQYYYPYRNSVEKTVSQNMEKGEKLLHISVHSFTPVLEGKTRNADVGLLYDPSRKSEKRFSNILRRQLLESSPNLNVRFNYPYLGKADGFTTYLRKKFKENYIGLELEINQKYVEDLEMAEEIKKAMHKAVKLSVKLFKDE